MALYFLPMNLDSALVKEKVTAYIKEAIHIDIKLIQDDTLIFKEGYFDSMGFMMLIAFIEEEFKIKTTDADLVEENFESVNTITEFVSRKINN